MNTTNWPQSLSDEELHRQIMDQQELVEKKRGLPQSNYNVILGGNPLQRRLDLLDRENLRRALIKMEAR